MRQVTLDKEVLETLLRVDGPVEVFDIEGRLVGRFIREPDEDRKRAQEKKGGGSPKAGKS